MYDVTVTVTCMGDSTGTAVANTDQVRLACTHSAGTSSRRQDCHLMAPTLYLYQVFQWG